MYTKTNAYYRIPIKIVDLFDKKSIFLYAVEG